MTAIVSIEKIERYQTFWIYFQSLCKAYMQFVNRMFARTGQCTILDAFCLSFKKAAAMSNISTVTAKISRNEDTANNQLLFTFLLLIR